MNLLIKENELSTYSLLNYITSEGDILISRMDWQDFKWINEDPIGFNSVHLPIEINEDILKQLGFSDKNYKSGYIGIDVNNTDFVLTKPEVNAETEFEKHYRFEFQYGGWPRVMTFKYVHLLQKFFFVFYEKELLLVNPHH